MLRSFNALMAGVCEPGAPDCVFVDGPLSTAWDGDDFVDESHRSRRSGQKLAALIANRITQLAAASRASD